ncbi:NADH-quinone oxidoreductase subunit NuoE [Rhodococcus sp. X156]|uniref:NADH-quinone oxidoreductase subunit NuoE n=1 Tax=Rhodococcus sp. X156 TaxID=2499145 RepID=UPI000FD88667|nr:NADH-quinone oxidoreductase subunit NuoE [Rhodococcus sp. X156]
MSQAQRHEAGFPGARDPGTGDPGAGDPGTGETFDALTHDRAQEIIARYPQARSALLPMLHLVQSVQGWVSPDGIAFCADHLHLTPAEVRAVATFYTMYKRRPCGEHLVSVCTNTLCAVLGGDDIYQALQAELGQDGALLGHEETAGVPGAPGSITLEHAECLAACDLGPVLQVNYEYFDNQTPQTALELVRALRSGQRPDPSRGAPLTDLRDAELQLAGFFTSDPELHGPSAAPETLRGVVQAQENGWQAPALPDSAPPLPVPEKKS